MTSELVRDDVTGAVLGERYRIRALIGRGGMASVYRAHDQLLGRIVAVKVFADGPEASAFVERNRSEVSVLASLNHPALVTLFDANLLADPPYLVMELVDGLTLHDRLAGGPMPAGEVVALVKDLSDALDVVHASGVVHRDIKPSNVLLANASGARAFRAKLADFGIAQFADGTRLTTPGTFVGTAAYVAPEQTGHGVPASPADVYSLGLVALECLTGARAFPGTPAESVSNKLRNDPGIPESVPVALRQLLSAMTARDAGDRPTARAVHELALEAERRLEDEGTSDHLSTAPMDGATGPLTRTAVMPGGDARPGSGAAVADTGRADSWRGRAGWGLLGAALVLVLSSVAAVGAIIAPPPVQPELPGMNAPTDAYFEQLLEAVTP